MDLVVHHVLEALVVCGPDEDLGGELAAGEAVVEDLQWRDGERLEIRRGTQ